MVASVITKVHGSKVWSIVDDAPDSRGIKHHAFFRELLGKLLQIVYGKINVTEVIDVPILGEVIMPLVSGKASIKYNERRVSKIRDFVNPRESIMYRAGVKTSSDMELAIAEGS